MQSLRDTDPAAFAKYMAAKYPSDAKAEAIATADARTNNADLPTYSELVEALRRLSETYDRYSATGRRHQPAAVQAAAILNRIPA